MRCRRAGWAATAALLLGLPGAAAAPAAQATASTWTLVDLPGGVAGLRRLLGPAVDAGRVFIETARRIDSPDDDEAGVRRDLRDYMEAVDSLWQALNRLPSREARLSLSSRQGAEAAAVEGVLEAVGLQWGADKRTPSLVEGKSRESVSRRRVLAWAGIDPESVARRVNAGEAVAVSLSVDRVPLPMPEETWRVVVFEGGARGGIARAVVSDRRASLLAHGLSSLDPQTLAWLTARPDLLREIYRDHAGSFAVFGRSLRIDQGRLVSPGGARARRLWEQLVGAPTSDPERFTLAMLDRDEGRLAWLYDTVAHLDDPHATHLLGLAEDEAAGRTRMETLARAFVEADRGIWRVDERPFRRPSPDPALFLGEVALDGTGRVISPISRAGWETAIEGGGAPGEVPVPAAGEEARAGDVDLAWLTGRVFAAAPRVARDRFDMVLFAQRVFGSAPPGASGDVVAALAGYLAFPTLALTLERMELRAPDLHAAAAQAAGRLTSVGDEGSRYQLLRQFQGALALAWRLHAVGAIDTAAASRLASSLVGLRVDPNDQFAGAVARWIRAELLPAIGAPPPAGVEESLLVALSGGRRAGGEGPARGGSATAAPGASPALTVEWEGLPYVLDLAGADERALRRTREAQGGYSLDQAVTVSEAGEALISAAGPDTVRAQRAALAPLVDRLPPIREAAGMHPALALEPARVLARALADLDRVRSARDLPHARNAGGALVRLGDALLGDALSAWAYAVAAIGSDDPGLQTMGLVRRHDLSPRSEVDPERRRGPWRLPRPVPVLDVPWHVAGSLLALDFAFAEARLRRVDADTPPSPSAADDIVRFGLAQHVVVLDGRRLTDGARDAIVAAVSRGRARAAAVAGGRGSLDALARTAGVSEWRRESIRWLAGVDPAAVPGALSLGELLLLGLEESGQAAAISPWGPSALPLTGALRGRLPAAREWEALAGHRGTGMVAAAFMDLVIRVAQALSEANLPAAIAPNVLAAATWDLCADVQLASTDDWLALVARTRAIPGARFDDYVATLTGEGPLAPAGSGAQAAVP